MVLSSVTCPLFARTLNLWPHAKDASRFWFSFIYHLDFKPLQRDATFKFRIQVSNPGRVWWWSFSFHKASLLSKITRLIWLIPKVHRNKHHCFKRWKRSDFWIRRECTTWCRHGTVTQVCHSPIYCSDEEVPSVDARWLVLMDGISFPDMYREGTVWVTFRTKISIQKCSSDNQPLNCPQD